MNESNFGQIGRKFLKTNDIIKIFHEHVQNNMNI